jgi:collagenase-like PrtC family protease
MKLALGPLHYYWPRDRVVAFYAAAARWPVSLVYLGETVCSRRHELRLADWLEIGERLAAAGKEVVLSTFELIETEADLRQMRSVVGNGRFRVEANDMGAVHLLSGRAPWIAGPFLNIYNADTLALFASLGATRWIAPVEISGAGLADVLAEGPADMETEVFAWGRLPLAASARCFTARYHNLTKDHCDYRCLDDPDGLVVRTQDDEAFLVLNGVQTQSARAQSLMPHFDECRQLAVDVLRLSPQPQHMERIVRLFDAVNREEASSRDAQAELETLAAHGTCEGYWRGRPGMERPLA